MVIEHGCENSNVVRPPPLGQVVQGQAPPQLGSSFAVVGSVLVQGVISVFRCSQEPHSSVESGSRTQGGASLYKLKSPPGVPDWSE